MSVGKTEARAFGSYSLNERLPYVITGFGAVLGLVLIVEGVLVATHGLVVPDGYAAGVASSILFVGGLLFGGYWIQNSHISPEQYGRIGLWTLAGTIGFTAFIAALSFAAGPLTLVGIVSTIRWAASVGAGLGLVIGVFNAQTIQQAFQAGLVRRREAETRQERDRLDEFASVVSHDLRSPLNVAQGRLELAAQDCESEHLEAVAEAHDRMNTLIEDVLSLARAGDAIGDSSPVELSLVVETGWRHVDAKSARLANETEGTILADESRLQQLLENLFRNAIEHGGEGVTVTVGDLPDGFYVEDDGPGIPENERGRILDPGYSTSETGTGFGLSIVRDIAVAHGWEITVVSGVEKGARFEFAGVRNAKSGRKTR